MRAISDSYGTGFGDEGSLPTSQGWKGLGLRLFPKEDPFIPDFPVLGSHHGYQHVNTEVTTHFPCSWVLVFLSFFF